MVGKVHHTVTHSLQGAPVTCVRFKNGTDFGQMDDGGGSRQVSLVAGTSDGVRLFACGGGGVADAANVAKVTQVAQVALRRVAHLCFDARDSLLVAHDGNVLSMLQCKASSLSLGHSVSLPCSSISRIAVQDSYSPSSSSLLSAACEDGSVSFVDLAHMRQINAIGNADSAAITGIQWLTVNELAISTDAGRVAILDHRANSSKAVHSFHDLRDVSAVLNCMAVHPTQKTTLATGSADGAVKVWDLRSTKEPELKSKMFDHNSKEPEVKSFSLHSSDVWDLVFPKTNAYTLACCSQDGLISHFTWNYNNPDGFEMPGKNPSAINKISGQGLPVNSLDCHDEQPLLVAAGDAGQVILTEI
ncbi:WD40-repeat-containing domain protein [Chytriomyces cf. hyalinus JEL632]|nr:WD40-repeat-containing domain protein [Chytriomyces cf. hyalinus JEL632]